MLNKRFIRLFVAAALATVLVTGTAACNVPNVSVNVGVPDDATTQALTEAVTTAPEAAVTTEAPITEPETTQPETTEPETPPADDTSLFAEMAGEFKLSSGVGAWASLLTLEADGSFTFSHSDTNMGERGEGYKATKYMNSGTGQFSGVTKVNDYTYSCTVTALACDNEPGTEIIDENGLRIKYTKADALTQDAVMTVYTPDAPVSALPEELFKWITIRTKSKDSDTLNCYVIVDENNTGGMRPYVS